MKIKRKKNFARQKINIAIENRYKSICNSLHCDDAFDIYEYVYREFGFRVSDEDQSFFTSQEKAVEYIWRRISNKIFFATWTDEEYMKLLGYKLIKDDGEYAKYENLPGTVNPGYGRMFAGKQIIYINRGYQPDKDGVFVGIREDGDTRNVFNGFVKNEQFFLNVIDAVR